MGIKLVLQCINIKHATDAILFETGSQGELTQKHIKNNRKGINFLCGKTREKLRLALEDKQNIDELMAIVTKVTKQKISDLRQSSNGKRQGMPYRGFAIYACHRYSQADHSEIANYFGLTS